MHPPPNDNTANAQQAPRSRWIMCAKAMRLSCAIAVLVVSIGGIGFLFWYTELVYSLPTPVPLAYHVVPTGSKIELGAEVGARAGRPVFLHFFNPRCPCSRFNIPEFNALVHTFSERIDFRVVVVPKNGEEYEEQEIRDQLGTDLPILFDRKIAWVCGVYSTPQAVLIDGGGKLYYRGNYNRSRYCTAQATNYARSAIESLLMGRTRLEPDLAALVSYGCALPSCTRK